MTARALANAAAARGWRVLLVDADMRSVLSRPKTDATVVGLAEVLRGELDVIHAMRQTSNSALTILPAGRLRDNPIRLLSMKPAQTVFESLADRFDLVIVDGPPVMAGGDCWMLAQHVDQTILISEWAETSPTAIRTALRHLAPPRAAADQRAPVEVAGIVLNQVDPRKSQRIDDSDSIIFSTAAEYYPGAR
jgi:Mrp family chromosome partitioning ATPase